MMVQCCSLCHFGRGSQPYREGREIGTPAVRSAISAEVHSDNGGVAENGKAVRSAISAEVHSQVWHSCLDQLGCSLCHFGRGSQPESWRSRAMGSSCSLCHFGRGSQRFKLRDESSNWAVRSAISAEVHSVPSAPSDHDEAVRSAISAEVHSLALLRVLSGASCSLCHFGRGSQQCELRRARYEMLFALPFRQRFTARRARRPESTAAVRSAISAEVHSVNIVYDYYDGQLFALPFRQRFTASTIGDGGRAVAVRSAISAEVHSLRG